MKHKQLSFFTTDLLFRKSINENSYNIPTSNFRIADEKSLELLYKDDIIDWKDIFSLPRNINIKKELINEMTPIGKDIAVEYEKFIKAYKRLSIIYTKNTQKLYRQTINDNNKYFVLTNL